MSPTQDANASGADSASSNPHPGPASRTPGQVGAVSSFLGLETNGKNIL